MEIEGIQAIPLSVYRSESREEDVQTHNSTDNGEEGNSDYNLSDLSQVDVRGCFTGLRARTLEELYDLYRKHSHAIGFAVRSTTQRIDRDGRVIEKYYVCSCEGYKNGKKEVPVVSLNAFNAETSPKPRRKARKFLKTRTGCKANIRIKIIGGAYEVKNHVTCHNHELTRTEEEAISIQEGFSIGSMLKGSSYFDMIETDAGGDESESNIFSETPLKRKELDLENEVVKHPKISELRDKNDDVPPGFAGSTKFFAPSDNTLPPLDSINPEGKSEAELKKLVDCGSTMAAHYLKAVQALLAMKDKQLQNQTELANQEILKRKEMEEKLLVCEKRVEQLQAEQDYIYKRGFRDVCSKLLASDEFGQRICNALFAGRECVVSKNSRASHDALMKALDSVQSAKYTLLDVIHPGMSFDGLKAWSLETGNQSSLSSGPFFRV